MIKAERHDRIVAELAKRGAIGVQELADMLDASAATIRRDIAELDARSIVVRTHGGAILHDRSQELPFDAKIMAFHIEKRRIGAMAASMLKPGQVVGLGGGTTVMNIIAAVKKMPLHIVTTAVNVALELRDAPDVEVLLTGGVFRKRTAELVGHVAERTLMDINLDVAIIGIDGIDVARGLTTYDSAEAFVNRVLISRAKEVWIVSDHSKFGQVLPAVITQVSSISKIFTDHGADPKIVKSIEDLGTSVVLA